MNFEQHRLELEQDGFTVVRQFLSGEELVELMSNVDRYIREVVPGLPDSDAFYQDKSRPETLKQMQHMNQDPFFEAYRKNPKWITLATALLGEPVESQGAEWFNKPPGIDHQTPPHQDNFYFNLKPPSVITAWLALDPTDEENGCLRYVRGSHRHGLRPHHVTSVLGFSQGVSDYGPADQQLEVVIKLQPGDLAIHHGETIHRADANRSFDRPRRAFAMVIRGQSCRLDEEGNKRYLESARQQHASMGLQAGLVNGFEKDVLEQKATKS